jgi:hypothetical protein
MPFSHVQTERHWFVCARAEEKEENENLARMPPIPTNLLPFAFLPRDRSSVSGCLNDVREPSMLPPRCAISATTNLHSSECLFSLWLVTLIQQGSYLVWVDLDDHFLVGALEQRLVSILGHAQNLHECRGNVFMSRHRQQ